MTDTDDIDQRVQAAFDAERERERQERRERLRTIAMWVSALCAVLLVTFALLTYLATR